MPDHDKKSSSAFPLAATDLLSLDAATQAGRDSGPGASSQDSILNAAEVFQAQLDQMTTWKHQLAQQMEVMRRDGIKLLERQKNLAIERKRASEERESLAGERTRIQQLQHDLDAQTRRLTQRAADLESSHAELQKLRADRDHWERELAAARTEVESLAARKSVTTSELAAAEARLAEIRALEARRDELLVHIAEAEKRLLEFDAQRKSLEAAHHELDSRQAEFLAGQKALAEQRHALEADVQARMAQAEALRQQAAEEREGVQSQRRELQKKLDALDLELAEQLESLAKQTKRLTERRSTIEAAERDLDKALETRIAAATNALRGELSDVRATYEQRIAGLEQQIANAQSTAQGISSREESLELDLAKAHGELAKLRDELVSAGAAFEELKDKNTAQAMDLAATVERARAEAAQWQATLDSAKANTANDGDALRQARQSAAEANSELESAKARLAALKSAHEELQFQLEVQSEEAQKQLRALQNELVKQLAQRDQEIAEWKAKYQAAASAPVPEANAPELAELEQQCITLEQQRTDLAQQLFTVQDELRMQQEESRRAQEESLLAKNGLEARLITLQNQLDTLEAEKSAWPPSHAPTYALPTPAHGGAAAPLSPLSELPDDAANQITAHRHRLLQKARTLRAFRLQVATVQRGLEKNREEIAGQREQLRARKENLEQVKRLLEKQEMVMARKLADHNAIKTVAAVGIFVIMILIGAFAGVYQFVHPVYRSEALIKLAPPANLADAELDTWLKSQSDFMRSPVVTSAAWKILRSGEEHYGMQDVREEWLNSLARHLVVDLDSANRTLFVRYSGPDAQGVSQVCNALATAYTTPSLREQNEQTLTVGLGSVTSAKATVPLSPIEDSRMMISLSAVAAVMFISLLLVMLFRHFVARQLKEIDQMADAQDLDEVQGELGSSAA